MPIFGCNELYTILFLKPRIFSFSIKANIRRKFAKFRFSKNFVCVKSFRFWEKVSFAKVFGNIFFFAKVFAKNCICERLRENFRLRVLYQNYFSPEMIVLAKIFISISVIAEIFASIFVFANICASIYVFAKFFSRIFAKI
jgi:hypothetical protein